MNSEEELQNLSFSSSVDRKDFLVSDSSDYSELRCEDKREERISDSVEEDLIFSSVADFEKNDDEYKNKIDSINDQYKNKIDSINDKNKIDSVNDEYINKTDGLTNYHIIKIDSINYEDEYINKTDALNNEHINKSDSLYYEDEYINKTDNKINVYINNDEDTTSSFTNNNKKIKIDDQITETGFTTGNKKKLLINKNIMNRTPKFVASHRGGPMRSYNCPERGHISSELEEKNIYCHYFSKIRNEFKKTDKQLLLIQYRWVWMDLYINKLINDSDILKMLIEGLRNRLNSEYSILRRIVEGDDVSYRYMILLVISVNKNIVEVYDGYFSVNIRLDDLLTRYFHNSKIVPGQKIRLFGCKYILGTNKAILDHNEEDIVMECFFNSFSLSPYNRKLGYRKKISFIRKIKDINKEGGIVSCIKGNIKRIIESKFIVQVKGYRNSVENLEDELEKIQNLIEKTKEEVTNEDVKIRKFVRFILQDDSGECLITSWLYPDQIIKDCKLMICGLTPVKGALGIHLTTTKLSYMKFY